MTILLFMRCKRKLVMKKKNAFGIKFPPIKKKKKKQRSLMVNRVGLSLNFPGRFHRVFFFFLNFVKTPWKEMINSWKT